VAKLSAHTKKVTDVLFHSSQDLIFTTSTDKSALIWTPETSRNKKKAAYKVVHTFAIHTDEVTGITLQPSGDYVVTSSLDKSWAFHDIHVGQTVARIVDSKSESGYRCTNFHPDGLILGTATVDATVRIWDVKAQQNVTSFSGHQGPITSLSFSENGFYLATSSEDGVVKLWDLRKLTNINSIVIDQPINSVNFDYSGQYLVVAANDLRVYQVKTAELVKQFTDHGAAVTDAKFGKDAQSIVSVSNDRSLKIFSK